MMKEEDLKNIMKEPSAHYEKAETALLMDALKRSYTERFEMMTRLMKMNVMLKNATVTHKPDSSSFE